MSIGAPPQQDGAPERALIVQHRPAGRRRTIVWIATILALLVGVAGGYGLRWGLWPSKTATKPPPAYTTATSVRTQVYFDGKTCTYSGPAEFRADANVTFNYTAAVSGSFVVLAYLEPGTTYEDVVRSFTGPFDGSMPTFVRAGYMPDYPVNQLQGGPRRQILEKKMQDGLFALLCAFGTESPRTGIFPATMLRVIPD